MGLPVDVFRKLEDPPEGWAVYHSSQLVGKSLFECGESLPETFLGQGIDQGRAIAMTVMSAMIRDSLLEEESLGIKIFLPTLSRQEPIFKELRDWKIIKFLDRLREAYIGKNKRIPREYLIALRAFIG